jgi:hypothetical protein
MQKISVSIIQYGDISNKAMHAVAINLIKNNFEVNYYWCMPGAEPFSDFKHPSPSRDQIENILNNLESSGVNVVEFKVDKRLVYVPTMPWIGTNFFEKFSMNGYKYL